MKSINSLSYNELRTEAKKLGIKIKNGTKEQYIREIKKALNRLEVKKEPKVTLVSLLNVKQGQTFTYPTGKKVCKIVSKQITDGAKNLFQLATIDGGRTWNEVPQQKVALCQ